MPGSFGTARPCAKRLIPILSPLIELYFRFSIILRSVMSDIRNKSPVAVVDSMPEAFVSHAHISSEVSRRVAAGRLRKLATRLYTRNLDDDADTIVRRNLWNIVAGYFPGALIADRTAIELEPAEDGSICLVSPRGSEVELPGVIVRPRRGAPRQTSDLPFMNKGLHLSSSARAYLDNLRSSRARRGRVRRTLSRIEIEERLEGLMASAGVEVCNRLRDEAQLMARDIDRESEFLQLDAIVSAMAGTRSERLRAPSARARAHGRPYDASRLALFEELFKSLRRMWVSPRQTSPRDGIGNATLAFFDAYFSNYIEGTEFAVDEAAHIVFEGRVPRARPEDAHDILGVWRIVSDISQMRMVPEAADQLIELLRTRHAAVFEGRPSVNPGQFKMRPNRVGSLVFVSPDAVLGTLERGFDMSRGLESAFHRAVFMHFLVSEIHPFEDGNGRLARIMMNAELIAANEERIVIPTVYRANYIAAQRALSSGHSTEPLIRALDFAWDWTASVSWGILDSTVEQLRACHAFVNDAEASERGIRLQRP